MRPAPRVVLIAPHFPPETVAGAARLSSLAQELAALGHDVEVVAPGPGPEGPGLLRAPAVRHGRGVVGNAAWQLALGRALAAAVERVRTADVALVSTPPPLAALLAARAAAQRGMRVVVDVRDIWPDVLVEAGALGVASPGAAVLRVVERRLLGLATALVTVTEAKGRRLATRFSGPIGIAANGVDAAWLLDAPLYAGGGEGDFVALCAGNVGVAQDVGLLVRALAGRAREGQLRGEILGEGESLDEVRALAARLGAPVRFLPPVARAVVRQRLAACGAAVVTLRSAALADSVPSKLLEAMALAVPVVLVAAGEAATIVRESGGGIVVSPGDARGLAAALDRLASMSVDDRMGVGRRGREHVLARFRREDAARVVSDLVTDAFR